MPIEAARFCEDTCFETDKLIGLLTFGKLYMDYNVWGTWPLGVVDYCYFDCWSRMALTPMIRWLRLFWWWWFGCFWRRGGLRGIFALGINAPGNCSRIFTENFRLLLIIDNLIFGPELVQRIATKRFRWLLFLVAAKIVLVIAWHISLFLLL